ERLPLTDPSMWMPLPPLERIVPLVYETTAAPAVPVTSKPLPAEVIEVLSTSTVVPPNPPAFTTMPRRPALLITLSWIDAAATLMPVLVTLMPRPALLEKIGRASCRERVER